MKQIDGNQHM